MIKLTVYYIMALDILAYLLLCSIVRLEMKVVSLFVVTCLYNNIMHVRLYCRFIIKTKSRIVSITVEVRVKKENGEVKSKF